MEPTRGSPDWRQYRDRPIPLAELQRLDDLAGRDTDQVGGMAGDMAPAEPAVPFVWAEVIEAEGSNSPNYRCRESVLTNDGDLVLTGTEELSDGGDDYEDGETVEDEGGYVSPEAIFDCREVNNSCSVALGTRVQLWPSPHPVEGLGAGEGRCFVAPGGASADSWTYGYIGTTALPYDGTEVEPVSINLDSTSYWLIQVTLMVEFLNDTDAGGTVCGTLTDTTNSVDVWSWCPMATCPGRVSLAFGDIHDCGIPVHIHTVYAPATLSSGAAILTLKLNGGPNDPGGDFTGRVFQGEIVARRFTGDPF